MNRQEDNQRSSMIVSMERTLNSAWFSRRAGSRKDNCTLATSQYWDWITYIDDDYLSEWEVVKMKELYQYQLQELACQSIASITIGWGLTYPLMGPILRAQAQNFVLRLPATLSFATFIAVQGANWRRPSPTFTDIVSQPAPHGSYLRRTLREHFPVWWRETSAQLHAKGLSLPEMHEYDRQTKMPTSYSNFNTTRL
mmetsp:Transcript_7139/g.9954  ORF Transcript_7139/g.9954 Transcript_7139/m.9954 type:complete len:197 (-) Transcript_7139:94-684(-)